MLCPKCKNIPLDDRELEPSLSSKYCSSCEGNWLRYRDYNDWKSNKDSSTGATDNAEYKIEYDSKMASLCPDCGRILIKYKVSSNLPFSIDHCNSCNGIWLDKKEWELIAEKGLELQLDEIFTKDWQDRIRMEISKNRFEETYKKRFGEENYIKLKEIREWIYNGKQIGEMLAYLNDREPYKL